MRMRGALYRMVCVITILHSSPLTKNGGNYKKYRQPKVASYSMSLSGGFLVRVDLLTGALAEALESVLTLSFASDDGKM